MKPRGELIGDIENEFARVFKKGGNAMSFKNPDRLKKKKNKVWRDTRAPKISAKPINSKEDKGEKMIKDDQFKDLGDK